MTNPTAIIRAHDKTHGDWNEQSVFAHQLKQVMRAGKNWSGLTESQAEALDMIATKMSRIVSGDAGFEDHWADIAGYAMLGKGGNGK